ncbi:MAG TPA: uroporphyrinogen-III C-methyltransferase [Acidimicrobiales bacterium]|nr:uroporphyrinogen-III C-methyltransferase [Acidimicrobiales bacterium]
MTVFLVGAGPGDPGLLTRRGAELLADADVVVYDRLSVIDLLDLAPVDAERVNVGKTPGSPSTPQETINELLIDRGRRGLVVVRLKGGDPFVFARGGEEAHALARAGVAFEVVPGVTSAIAAPAYAGIPLTARGIATSFTVVTGHEDPWAATETDWEAVARMGRAGGTIVVLMGVATREAIAKRLVAGGLDPATAVAAITWGTRPEQVVVATTLAELGDAPIESPATIVIGAVAGLGEYLHWFDKRPLAGRTIVIAAPEPSALAGRLAGAIGAAGGVVIPISTSMFLPAADGGAGLAAAAGDLGRFRWVAFTSVTAVAAFADHVRDGRAFGAACVAAVGPATAAALADHFGVVADLVAARSTGAELAAALGEAPDLGSSILVPQAADARPELVDGLRARGWSVEEVEAYRAEPAPPPSGDVLARARVADAIVFTAPSSVAALMSLFGGVAPAAAVAMGPTTAAAAAAAGVARDRLATPEDASVPGLVAALVRLLS